MRSIFFRQFIATALLVILSFLIFGGLFLGVISQYLFHDRQTQLSNIAYYLSNYSKSYIYDDNLMFSTDTYALYDAGLGVISGVTGVQTMTMDTDGYIIACSDGNICSHINKKMPQEVTDAINDGESYTETGTLSSLGLSNIMLYAQPVTATDGTVVGAVIAIRQQADVHVMIRQFFQYFISSGALVFALSVLLCTFITRKMTQPLTRIAKAANDFAHEKYDTRIPVSDSAQDEVSQVARAFNDMAESMEKSEQIRRDFIANISHELRTPMTTISGYVDGILDGTIPREKEEYYLNIIKDETRRMNKLVQTMLEIARMQSGKITMDLMTFDMAEQCSQAALNMEERITGAGLGMDFDFPTDRVLVRADRDKITQVITNLLDNAIKFANKGSNLSIKVVVKGNKAFTSVTDEGEMIPEEDINHIFDRFHKADHSRGMNKSGLGLGLYIVKVILASHGEDIWVESKDGKTTFTFTLPLDDSKLKPVQNPTLRISQ